MQENQNRKKYGKTKFGNNVKFKHLTDHDGRGKPLLEIDSDGNEDISKYDANGNMIYCKEFSHYEQWWDYDENGNCVHYKNSEGTESWSEYNASGKLIYNRDLYESGAWYEYRYDEKTRREFMKNWEGFHCMKEYDENGNEILCKEADQ